MTSPENQQPVLETATGSGPEGSGFFITSHYMTDLSVECPGGRIADHEARELRLGYDARVAAMPMDEPDTHQVDATIQLQAAVGERMVFVAELTYRMVVRLHRIDSSDVEETLLVYVPESMNPAMKTIFEQTGAFSGYPDMQVGQFDFAKAFRQYHDSRGEPPVSAEVVLR